jgi:hypothetical protein
LIFIGHAESNAAINLSSVTYGGQAMTKVLQYATADGFAYAAAFILKETGVAAATSGTFVPTWSGTVPGGVGYTSVFLSNVNQTTSTGATGTGRTTTANPITTSASIATSSGDMVILGATAGNGGTYTLNNGFTEGIDQQTGTYAITGVTGHKAATGANETPSATFAGTLNRQMIIGLVVKRGVLDDMVSGGAGYVGQAGIGDSNTSNFSLTASKQSQMLTIAIAPADTNSCEGSIQP